MITISRDYTFSAAHQLEGHPKCGRLHGHNYLVRVVVEGNHKGLDEAGMVMDYGEMDTIVKPIIDQLDHRYIISEDNRKHGNPYMPIIALQGHGVEWNILFSTAECIAAAIWSRLQTLFTGGIHVKEVTVWETAKSSAVYEYS